MGAMVYAKLIDRLDPVPEDNEDWFDELPKHTDCTGITDAAARFYLDGRTFFLPLKHLRHVDGIVYCAKWLLEKEKLSG